jgi:hypothetical protein
MEKPPEAAVSDAGAVSEKLTAAVRLLPFEES